MPANMTFNEACNELRRQLDILESTLWGVAHFSGAVTLGLCGWLALKGCAPESSRDACRELVSIACDGCAYPCFSVELVKCAEATEPRELTVDERESWPRCAQILERGRACAADPEPYPLECPR